VRDRANDKESVIVQRSEVQGENTAKGRQRWAGKVLPGGRRPRRRGSSRDPARGDEHSQLGDHRPEPRRRYSKDAAERHPDKGVPTTSRSPGTDGKRGGNRT